MRVPRQTGKGPRAMHSFSQGKSDLCLQRADWTIGHSRCHHAAIIHVRTHHACRPFTPVRTQMCAQVAPSSPHTTNGHTSDAFDAHGFRALQRFLSFLSFFVCLFGCLSPLAKPFQCRKGLMKEILKTKREVGKAEKDKRNTAQMRAKLEETEHKTTERKESGDVVFKEKVSELEAWRSTVCVNCESIYQPSLHWHVVLLSSIHLYKKLS